MEMAAAGTFNLCKDEHLERRAITRTRISKDALIYVPGLAGVRPCNVRDVTNQGAGIRTQEVALLPLNFFLSFDKFRTGRECRLVWRNGDVLGVAFEDKLA